MSAVLALILLGTAAWFVVNSAGGSVRARSLDSVDEFARAMSALDPTGTSRAVPAEPPSPARRPTVPPRRPARRF